MLEGDENQLKKRGKINDIGNVSQQIEAMVSL
jgi:hypothetical protein